ncbi:MAG: rod shape-determining protein MreD [Bacteroidales bacterium]|nr:rod shape-determining protein MreD [Bacteroidales bacterium]
MNNRIENHIIRFILLILLQVYVINNILFFNVVNPYIYIYFILLLPFQTPKWLLTLLGFLIGFLVDLFTGSIAIHAAATTFISFLRPYILQLFAPIDEYQKNSQPTLEFYDLSWWIKYSLSVSFVHHSALFWLEKFNFTHFGFVLLKTIVSSCLSVFLMTLFQLFFNKPLNKK